MIDALESQQFSLVVKQLSGRGAASGLRLTFKKRGACSFEPGGWGVTTRLEIGFYQFVQKLWEL